MRRFLPVPSSWASKLIRNFAETVSHPPGRGNGLHIFRAVSRVLPDAPRRRAGQVISVSGRREGGPAGRLQMRREFEKS